MNLQNPITSDGCEAPAELYEGPEKNPSCVWQSQVGPCLVEIESKSRQDGTDLLVLKDPQSHSPSEEDLLILENWLDRKRRKQGLCREGWQISAFDVDVSDRMEMEGGRDAALLMVHEYVLAVSRLGLAYTPPLPFWLGVAAQVAYAVKVRIQMLTKRASTMMCRS